MILTHTYFKIAQPAPQPQQARPAQAPPNGQQPAPPMHRMQVLGNPPQDYIANQIPGLAQVMIFPPPIQGQWPGAPIPIANGADYGANLQPNGENPNSDNASSQSSTPNIREQSTTNVRSVQIYL